MADILPPAPVDAPFGSYNWADWYKKVRDAINNSSTVAWAIITGTPTTLAGYGITDGQPLDADLTALAALPATAGMLSRTGAGAFSARTLSSGTTALTIADPTGAAANPTFSVANVVAAGASGLMTGADKTKLDGAEVQSNKDAVSGYAGLNVSSRITKGADTTDDLIVDLATKGLVLKDTQGTPHYWRITISNVGALVITDVGTTKP